jgi:predicted metal-dependent peptidase
LDSGPETLTDLRPLQDAIVRLLKERPFYGHFLLQFRRRTAAAGPPLGVTIENGTPTLYVHPAVFAAFAPPAQKALLEHALKHVLHLHMVRRRGRHAHDWDIACDLAINPGIADLPPQGALPARLLLPEGLAAEEYYRLLTPPFDTGSLEGRGIGNAERDAGETTGDGGPEAPARSAKLQTLDDHAVWQEADSTPAGLAETVVRHLAREAWRQSHGEVPGELRPLVEGWLAPPPVPWRQVLRQFVATAGRIGGQSTWKRQHRRFDHLTPGMRKRRRLSLLVGVDVSDSTNVPALREAFARELLNIARGRDSRITVLYAGSRIQRIETFTGSAMVAEAYEGGGFTDLRPVFAYARTMHPRPAAVIYLTDGYGPAPEVMEFPTLWVLTKEGKMPTEWGVELRLEISEA